MLGCKKSVLIHPKQLVQLHQCHVLLQSMLAEASTTSGHQDASVLYADCTASSCSHVGLHEPAMNKLSVVQTARLKAARGLLELAVPLRLKAGPTVMLHMKASLLTPDVQLSSPTLPFGPVQTGKCKVPSLPSLKPPRPSSLSYNCLLTILLCCSRLCCPVGIRRDLSLCAHRS